MKGIIDEDLLFVDLEFENQKALFEFCGSELEAIGRIDDKDAFVEALEERESFSTTAIGDGFAIPHCNSVHVQNPTILFIRLREPMSWTEGEAVTRVCMIAVSGSDASRVHLELLSNLSKKFMDTDFKDNLKQAKNKHELFQLFQ